ncbi:TRAP transporter small permease [Spirochaeta isovalerica]|uniref:TRAP-type C4-dicarboxylate transport system permease small subunit n=1 Tax=Spirochaeta isovalerica TaxID=150 RepID=A0A841R7Z6_9SPIO|nr:TRAP transporter small permease [Spirochaeta isovalerica]MBB6479995.1 TRAP-type C4-dicarboxylate transport system permease small subunit [Spirochaeta isovalerica]
MKIKDQFVKIEKLFNMVLISFTTAMFIIVIFNVFMRFVLNNSIGWADELSRFIFIWISFLGAVLAYKSDEHVGLSFIVDKIKSSAVRKSLFFIQRLAVLFVLLIMTYYGYIVTISAKNVSPALSITLSTVYMIVPFCALLMTLLAIGKIAALFSGKNGDAAEKSEVTL